MDRQVEAIGLRRAWFSLVMEPAAQPGMRTVYQEPTENVRVLGLEYHPAPCPPFYVFAVFVTG